MGVCVFINNFALAAILLFVLCGSLFWGPFALFGGQLFTVLPFHRLPLFRPASAIIIKLIQSL